MKRLKNKAWVPLPRKKEIPSYLRRSRGTETVKGLEVRIRHGKAYDLCWGVRDLRGKARRGTEQIRSKGKGLVRTF